MDLLYWDEHYALITKLSAFLSDLSTHQHKLYFCRKCFGHHVTKEALINHNQFCKTWNLCNQIYILPEKGTKLSFKNVKYQQECPIVIYADFECLTKKFEPSKQNPGCYQHHQPISVAYKVFSRVSGFLQNYPV